MAPKWDHKLIMISAIFSVCFISFPLISGVRSETPANWANQPAIQPTVAMTIQPVIVPTNKPIPTIGTIPTANLTIQPTVTRRAQPDSANQPTLQPTLRSTIQSTKVPTIRPIVQPTARPTPTVRPTIQPTVTKRAQPELMKLAVIVSTNAVEIPTFGSLKWYKDGLAALIDKEVTATFPASKYTLTPAKILADVLAESGYSPNALEMPEKGDLIEIANNAGADAILVIELSSIGLSTTQEQYQFYTIIRYKAYNAKEDTYLARRIFYEGQEFKHSTPEKDKVFYTQTITNAVDLVLSGLPF